MKKTLILLSALTFVSCVDKKEREQLKKDNFLLSAEIGQKVFKNQMLKLVETDSTPTWEKLDSIYKVEINKIAKDLYNEK